MKWLDNMRVWARENVIIVLLLCTAAAMVLMWISQHMIRSAQ